jgi:hypothetical protein
LSDNVSIKDAANATVPILTDEITTRNGGAVTAVQAEVVKVATGGNGVATDVSEASPFPVKDGGTFAYRAGGAPVTVTVPAGARLRYVGVVAASDANATVTIAAGQTITVPAGMAFERALPGTQTAGDVVIAGSVTAYYVDWVA